MAKISAYGSTALATLKVTSAAGYPVLLVMASDGRLLSRYTGDLGSSYKVVGKVKNTEKRTMETLRRYALLRGYTFTN